jgi:glycosyltransferase involved in cell wall biosynthesis
MSTLNVLYLTMNPNRASTTVPTEGWFRLLPARGLHPALVSHQPGAFHDWAVETGIPAYAIELPFPSKSRPVPFLRSLWRLRGLVRRHGIELIHCNEQNIYPIGQYLGRLCGLPVVVSVHFTMGRDFCRWAFGGARRPRRIFFVSRGNREACRDAVAGIIPESDWRVLENGLDLERFRPDAQRRERFRLEHGLAMDTPVLGVACALRARKQLEHLFEAVARLDSPRLRVAVAGGPVPGDEAYADALVREARRRLGERLIYLGHLEELRDLYNGLDVFVNTSQEEACSISVIEALACGLPVVGYPSKSVDGQVLPDGGEIVPQDRIDLLTEALGRWISDPGRMGATRADARRQAEDRFDIQRLADRLWDEYQAVVTRREPVLAAPPPRGTSGPLEVVQ